MSKINPGASRPTVPSATPTAGKTRSPQQAGAASAVEARTQHPDDLQDVVLIAGGQDGLKAIETMNRATKGMYQNVCIVRPTRAAEGAPRDAAAIAHGRGAKALGGEVLSIRQLADGSFRLLFREGPPVDTRRVIFAADYGQPAPALEFEGNEAIKAEAGWEVPGKDKDHGITFQGGAATALTRRAELQQKQHRRQAQLDALNSRWDQLAQLSSQKKEVKEALATFEGSNRSRTSLAYKMLLARHNELKNQFSTAFNAYQNDAEKFSSQPQFEAFNQQAFETLDFCSTLHKGIAERYETLSDVLRNGRKSIMFGKIPCNPDDALQAAVQIVNDVGIEVIITSSSPIDEKCDQLQRLNISEKQIAAFRRDMTANSSVSRPVRDAMYRDVVNFFESNQAAVLQIKPADMLL